VFKKLLPFTISILIVITLILTAAFFLWNYVVKKSDATVDASSTKAANSVKNVSPKPLSAAKKKDLTVQLKEITTNLATKGKIIVVGFAFVLDSNKAVDEFKNLDVKVNSIINQTLSDLTVEQVSGSAGQDALTSMLMNKINAIMNDGKVTEIDIPKIVTQ
jgi:flagellar FliL protein